MTTDYYDQNAQSFFDSTVGLDMSLVYEKFEKHLPARASLLDAGCGSGRDSLHFINRGYRVSAFDASPEMVRLASALTGLPVRCHTFQELDDVAAYDGIWACASLLHVPRLQIDDVFRRLTRALKPSGAFYLSFKLGSGEAHRHGRLFNDYTRPAFLDLLARHPTLTLAELWITPDSRPDHAPEKWLDAILRKERS